MSKRRGQGIENLCSSCKRSLCRKHLYLVLDDWNKGFTIHKIDAASFHTTYRSAGDDEVADAGYLTDPPAVRLQAPGDTAPMLFTAVGNKIFIVTDQRCGQTPALVYDTGTAGLAFGPGLPAHGRRGFNVVVAAGDALYGFLPPRSNKPGSVQVMSWKLTALDHHHTGYSSEEALSWTSLPGPHPVFHGYEGIASYAVHPDEHTIFMTTTCSCMDCHIIQKSTYSFNTQTCVWKWHAWVLPFEGPGFFDRELDAWVGLRRDGSICSCRVATDSGSATPIKLGRVELDYQIMRNKLFRRDPEKYLGASLTHMGARRFCLVETVIDRRVSREDYYSDSNPATGCELHITIFDLRYNHKGELQTASNQSIRSYKLAAKYKHQFFTPVAFWM